MLAKNNKDTRKLLLRELSLLALGIIVTSWSVYELTFGASDSVPISVRVIDEVSGGGSSSSSNNGTTASIDPVRQTTSLYERKSSQILVLFKNSLRFGASPSAIEHAATDEEMSSSSSRVEHSMENNEVQGSTTSQSNTSTDVRKTTVSPGKQMESTIGKPSPKKNVSVEAKAENKAAISIDTCTFASFDCVREAFSQDRRLMADIFSDLLPLPSLDFMAKLPLTEPITWALIVFWIALFARGSLLCISHYRQ